MMICHSSSGWYAKLRFDDIQRQAVDFLVGIIKHKGENEKRKERQIYYDVSRSLVFNSGVLQSPIALFVGLEITDKPSLSKK